MSDSLTVTVKTTDHRVARSLLDVVPRAMRVVRRELRLHAGVLTVPQFRVLVHASRRPRTNTELAELQGVSRSAMSRMVDGLAAKGLIARQPDPEDSRSVAISVTDSGRAVYDEMRQKAQRCFAEVLATLPDEEKAPLTRGLEALLSFVDAYDKENPAP